MKANQMSWLLMVLLVSLVWSTGCAGVQRAAADVLIPVEEENRLGQELSQQIDAELRIHSDEQLQRYVRDLGAQILRHVPNNPRGINYRFVVIDDIETINAFAIPGGHIYVYTGLLRVMDNEAELAAVLSHEIAHVTRRHVAQRLVAAYGAESVSRMALGQEPGLIAQLVTAVVGQGFMLRYSRDQERDADEWGLQYAVAADYNPEAFLTFFRKLRGGPTVPSFLSTHPSPDDRIEYMSQWIRRINPRPTRLEEARFQAVKARL